MKTYCKSVEADLADMDDPKNQLISQLKTSLLRALYPNLSKGYVKKLKELADSKGINWVGEDGVKALDNILGSMFRHEYTKYDEIVHKCGPDRARFYIQTIISDYLCDAKKSIVEY